MRMKAGTPLAHAGFQRAEVGMTGHLFESKVYGLDDGRSRPVADVHRFISKAGEFRLQCVEDFGQPTSPAVNRLLYVTDAEEGRGS